MEEIILKVIGALLLLAIMRAVMELVRPCWERRKKPAEEPDPCETCLRWSECNGEDQATCLVRNAERGLVPCPKCGAYPEWRRVGDLKQFFIYQCERCGYIAAHFPDEASCTKEGAREIWNRRVNGGNDLISRRALLENLNTFAPEHYNALVNMLITKQPAVDAVVLPNCDECFWNGQIVGRYQCEGCIGNARDNRFLHKNEVTDDGK